MVPGAGRASRPDARKRLAGSETAVGVPEGGAVAVPHPRHDGGGTMNTAIAVPGNTADTFLVHFFGGGLADERYVVERFKAHVDGDIRPWPARRRRRGRAGGRSASPRRSRR